MLDIKFVVENLELVKSRQGVVDIKRVGTE